MENLTLNQLRGLAEQTATPSISIFIPTNRVDPGAKHNRIGFKNILRDAEKQLLESGMGPRVVKTFLQPAQALLEDQYFWQHQYDGLAVFLARDDFHSYRLPMHVDELLSIAQSFYVKPLLPLFTNNGHYYILALSQNEVRLFEGARHSVGQIDLPEGTPASLEEALDLDDPQKQITSHGGKQDGLYHGQGSGDDDQERRIEQYFKLVDAGLRALRGEQPIPLILAGVDYLLPIYRNVSEYPNIIQEGIPGSPEHLRPEELQERAWLIVDAYFRQETEAVVAQYQQLAGTDKANDNVDEIVTAAFNGRVDKLILSTDAQVWGLFNPETGIVIQDPQNQSRKNNLALLDFAAIKTLHHGGKVYALPQDELPTASPSAAIFRYVH